MTFKYHVPVYGIGTALGLFVLATSHYPGGTDDTTGTVGFSWTRNFICSLFQPYALNGATNPARYAAIPAMLLLCISLGIVFKGISTSSKSRVSRKTIEISGIGTMVYAFLVVTPMHDLMVSIALCFALTALLATLQMLYVERRWSLFGGGAVIIAFKALSAGAYYGNVFFNLLPVLQKVSMVASIIWILSVYYVRSNTSAQHAAE